VIGFASVSRAGVPNAPQLMTGSPTAYEPRFVTPSLVTWHIRRQGYVRTIASGRPLETDRLPAGAAFGAVAAVDSDGTLVVAWPQDGRMLAAQRPAGGAFGRPSCCRAGRATRARRRSRRPPPGAWSPRGRRTRATATRS
jgi:hypothetical protein